MALPYGSTATNIEELIEARDKAAAELRGESSSSTDSVKPKQNQSYVPSGSSGTNPFSGGTQTSGREAWEGAVSKAKEVSVQDVKDTIEAGIEYGKQAAAGKVPTDVIGRLPSELSSVKDEQVIGSVSKYDTVADSIRYKAGIDRYEVSDTQIIHKRILSTPDSDQPVVTTETIKPPTGQRFDVESIRADAAKKGMDISGNVFTSDIPTTVKISKRVPVTGTNLYITRKSDAKPFISRQVKEDVAKDWETMTLGEKRIWRASAFFSRKGYKAIGEALRNPSKDYEKTDIIVRERMAELEMKDRTGTLSPTKEAIDAALTNPATQLSLAYAAGAGSAVLATKAQAGSKAASLALGGAQIAGLAAAGGTALDIRKDWVKGEKSQAVGKAAFGVLSVPIAAGGYGTQFKQMNPPQVREVYGIEREEIRVRPRPLERYDEAAAFKDPTVTKSKGTVPKSEIMKIIKKGDVVEETPDFIAYRDTDELMGETLIRAFKGRSGLNTQKGDVVDVLRFEVQQAGEFGGMGAGARKELKIPVGYEKAGTEDFSFIKIKPENPPKGYDTLLNLKEGYSRSATKKLFDDLGIKNIKPSYITSKKTAASPTVKGGSKTSTIVSGGMDQKPIFDVGEIQAMEFIIEPPAPDMSKASIAPRLDIMPDIKASIKPMFDIKPRSKTKKNVAFASTQLKPKTEPALRPVESSIMKRSSPRPFDTETKPRSREKAVPSEMMVTSRLETEVTPKITPISVNDTIQQQELTKPLDLEISAPPDGDLDIFDFGFNFPAGKPEKLTADFGKGKRRLSLTGRQKRAYTPSLIASELGLEGKKPKNITGLEIRPLPKGKKKKRRRLFDLF